MTEWIDVPVADVQTGDEVKVDGYGKPVPAGEAYSFSGLEYYSVVRITLRDVVIDWMQGKPKHVHIRRSSIVSARRRKPEPQPQPGDWRCGHGYKKPDSTPDVCYGFSEGRKCERGEVFRASGGWSRDTRTGQPWVMRVGDPVEIVVKSRIGNVLMDLAAAARTDIACGDEFLPDYYRRIGLKVVPVERRKR